MKKSISIIFLSLLMIGGACKEKADNEKPKTFLELLEAYERETPIRIETEEIGRYQIYQHPQFRGDIYLLDTKEGKVWQLVEDPKTKQLWWAKQLVEGKEED